MKSGYFCNTEKLLNLSIVAHGDLYDYSLVEYVSYNKPVKIICKRHGVFEQKPTDHKDKKRGCQLCGLEKALFNKYDSNSFIKKCCVIHNNKYDYSLVEYNRVADKVDIICPKHGLFKQKAGAHLRGKGCLLCKESKGELKISMLLNDSNIDYLREFKFDECKNINKLPFDFYLPKYNLCIEYDGEMHFKEIERFGGKSKLEYYKNNDNIKNKFCEDYNIKLYRIKFDQNIEEHIKIILENER